MNLIHAFKRAEVAELVDALGSGSSRGFPVEVRVLSSAPQIITGTNDTIVSACLRYAQL